MTTSLIGARVPRKEDYRFLTGAGQYTDDVALPGQTYAAFVRSPHAHATLKSIRTDKARKAPGVVAVFIAETAAQAKDAAELIEVDYGTLPAVVNPAKAKSGPALHEIAPDNTC